MNKQRGFTLIELLVVIAIIALLMSIMMPALGMVRRMAHATVCQSNVRHWGICYEMYADDNEDRAPGDLVCGLFKSYKNLDLLVCPAARKPGGPPANDPGRLRGDKDHAWFIPKAQVGQDCLWDGTPATVGLDSSRDIKGSYGPNGHVGGTGMSETGPETDWLHVRYKGTSLAPAVLDGGGGVPLPADEPPEYDGDLYLSSPMNSDEIRAFSINRHPGYTVNCLFLDFHAAKVTIKELWVLKWYRGWPLRDGIYYDLPDWPDWMRSIPDP